MQGSRLDLRNLNYLIINDILFARGELMKNNPLMKYSEELAVEIEKLCKSLEKRDNSNTIFQIRKSSSSVFANISEAQYPQSLPDMLSKFKISRKECVETESWLKLLYSSEAIDEVTLKKHRNLCGRIQRMLTSSCITIEKKINTTKEYIVKNTIYCYDIFIANCNKGV